MKKRRRQKVANCEMLEDRVLLAGTVRVNIVGRDLVVVGDRHANRVAVDLEATNASDLVQGLDGTSVLLSRDFNQFDGLDFDRIDDVRLRMRGGDDTVVIDFGQATIPGDLAAALGLGDDVFVAVGDEAGTAGIRDDVRVFGSRGDDQISLANLRVSDNLRVRTASGADVVAVAQTEVGDRTKLRTSRGDDTVLASSSRFGDGMRTRLGRGADFVGSVDNQFSDRVYVHGAAGMDTAFSDRDPVDDGRSRVVSVESVTDNAEDIQERAESVVGTARELLTGIAPLLDPGTADLIQNQLANFATSFGIQLISLEVNPESQLVTVSDPTPTVSVQWDAVVQQAIINTSPGPTIGSRASAMVHTAMYDAWSAYDPTAISTVLGDDLQRPSRENNDENKMEAMSFAAYRVLEDLFASESDVFTDLMFDLGYDPTDSSTDSTRPAGIGNTMAAALLESRHEDGSNQLGDSPDGIAGVPYSNVEAYESVNLVGETIDIEHWTPELVPIDAVPGTEDHVQEFLTPQWGGVTPFAIASGDQFRPAAPEPFLLVDGTANLAAGTITLADSSIVSIGPDLIGTVINPAFIAQAEHVVDLSANLTDEQKLIAEFWEDGGGTSFPPGTWMTFGQFVSARDNHSLDQDAQLFFGLGNAVFDAGIATWEAKVHYDYARPVRTIRELGRQGLIGEFDASLGGFAIDAWQPGLGTQRILATDFLTYQTPGSDPSPPFAEYTSGHSAFSAAGAEILRRFTGSDVFDASITFAAGESRFEPVVKPVRSVTLSWDTFTAAADEAGLSRLYGGIHFTDGDENGRTLGRSVGEAVWQRIQSFIDGA